MIVFKNFLRLLGRYRVSVGLYLLMFFIISILSGRQLKTTEESFVESKAEIAIVDDSGTELSRHFTRYMLSRNSKAMEVAKENVEEVLLNGVLDAVLIIPEKFEDNPTENVIEVQNSAFSRGASKVVQEVSGYMYLMLSARSDDGVVDYAALDKALEQKTEVNLLGKGQAALSREEWFTRFMSAAVYPVIGVVVFAIGIIMADFNAPKLAFRNKCSGMSLKNFQAGIFAGQMVFGVLVWVLIFIMAFLIDKENLWNPSLGSYGLNLAAFILAILSFTYFINSIIRNKKTLTAIANIFALGSSFISGAFVPMEYLGAPVRNIARFLPSYYFVMGNESIFLKNGELFFNIGIQLLFALVFLLLGFYFVKVKQKEAVLEL